MMTAATPVLRMFGHRTAGLIAGVVMLLPGSLLAQQPAQPAAAPAAKPAEKPPAYKDLLPDVKQPAGVNASQDFNRMKQTGVITSAPMLTEWIDYRLKSFISERNKLDLARARAQLKGDLRMAGVAQKKDVYLRITSDSLKTLTEYVRDSYPPSVRYNAVLMIGELNSSEQNTISKEKEPAVPLADALTVLLAELESDKQLEAVKVGAVRGIMRHAEVGKSSPEHKKQITQSMMKLVRTVDPPADLSRSGHLWLRSQAANILGAMGARSLEGEDNQVFQSLQAMMIEGDSPWLTRLAALEALGALDYTSSQGVPYETVLQQICDLWLEMIEEQSKEVPLKIAVEAAAAGGGGMMGGGMGMGGMPGGGMPGGGMGMMPGGGSPDGGGEAGGYNPGMMGGMGMGGMPMYDAAGNLIPPKPDRLVVALKWGSAAVNTALHGPEAKRTKDKPIGLAAAAGGSEKAKELIDGLETHLKEFKTVLDDKLLDWMNRVTQLSVKALAMRTWLDETAPKVVPAADPTSPAAKPAEATAAATPPAAGAVPANPDATGANPPAAAAPAGTVPANTATPATGATVSATP